MTEQQLYADDFYLWEQEFADYVIDITLPPLIQKVRDDRAAR